MGTATTPSIIRGLLVPDPRYRWSEAVTATSQTGPRPGVPKALDDTEMVLESSGTQASTASMSIKSIRAGHPGGGAAFIWKNTTDGVDDWRGWDPPVSLSGFEFINATTVVDRWRTPHALAMADGTICVAACKDIRQTVVLSRNPTTGIWTESEVFDPGAAFTIAESNPCLVELPNGRLLCIFWRQSSAGFNLRTYYSDDSGTTWTPGQKGALSAPILTAAHTPGRLRAAYLNGQICLVGHMLDSAPFDEIWQWASNDLGATFTYVDELADVDRSYPDIVEHNGTLVVVYVSNYATAGATYTPWCRVLGSAYATLSLASPVLCQAAADSMDWGSQSGGVFNSGEMSIWRDEDDRLWIMGRDHQGGINTDVATRTSDDGGSSWVDPGGGPSAGDGVSTWRGQDADTYPRSLTVCAHRGRAMVAHQCAANPGTLGPSIMAAFVGGYTSVCMPQETGTAPTPLTVAGFVVTWLPYDFPENVGNTVVPPVWALPTSTGARSLGSLGLHLTTAGGQQESYPTSAITGTIAEGLYVLAEVRVESGTATIELRTSDATPLQYLIEARATTSQVQLWDSTALADLGTVATTDAANKFIQILVELRGATAKMWYRPSVASGDRKWILVGQSAAVASSPATTSNRIQWGQGASCETYWRLVAYSADQYTERGLYGQDNFSDLLGRSYMPSPVWVDGGTRIHAVDGPPFRHDDWTISPTYEYPVSNIFPDVAGSPRRAWRSVGEVQQDIVVPIGGTITDTMGALIGVYLGDANFGKAELDGQTSGGAWVKIADIDRSIQTGLNWTRKDRMVRPGSPGNGVEQYLHENTLAGSYFAFPGEGEAQIVRKIETNSRGVYRPITSSMGTRILLVDVDETEGGIGSGGEIWSKDSLTVVPLTAAYKAFRLRIPAQDTYEGHFRIGSMVIGSFYPLGGYAQQYGWGRQIDWSTDWEQVEGRTGIRTVRALGPTRRAAEVQWVDGVETSRLGEASPSWVLGWVGGEPIAVQGDVPWSLPGLMEQLQGATTPVVFAPAVSLPANGTAAVDVTDRSYLLYGRITTESIQGTTVVGSEGESELIRVGTIRVEEEL
mgnify:CR=1 FL=1